MTTARVGGSTVERQLSEVGLQFLLTDLGGTQTCLSREQLARLAFQAFDRLDASVQEHLGDCPRCASTYASFRGVHCANLLPTLWNVALTWHAFDLPDDDRQVQILGYINLETRQFELCEDEDDWLCGPTRVRVNLVLDKVMDFVGLTVLDVPSAIRSVAFETPTRRVPLEYVVETADFETMELLSAVVGQADPDAAGDRFIEWLLSGDLRIHFEKERTPATEVGDWCSDAVRSVLEQAGAIERAYDYELPSGLHSDTHINVGAICRSEEALSQVAAAFHVLFHDVEFDTIATNGWAMATIARRLAALRTIQPTADQIQDVICEGYDRLMLTGDILPHSKVLILLDVNVTGTLSRSLQDSIRRASASVVGIGALVQAEPHRSRGGDRLRYLSSVEMNIVDPAIDTCPRCETLEHRVFNPVSYCMTQRAAFPRSPSEFLTQNADAREFWGYVDEAAAYEHHHKEADTHYIAFVDTKKLLEHPVIGPKLVVRLRDRIIASGPVPTVLLVPNRPRSRLLAERLANAFGALPRASSVSVVVAHRKMRNPRYPSRNCPWLLSPSERAKLEGARILIVDSAAGHGKTLDNLSRLAATFAPSAVGAAVLLSRLTDMCEQAFNSRLSGGFHQLYHIPIRPVVIRGQDAGLCPICQRKAAIQHVGDESGIASIKRWSEYVTKRFRRVSEPGRPDSKPVQLRLFTVPDDFLGKCRESVASGVTLHALNAAMTNGMAPLTLPEIMDDRIPSRNRAAMVENLPQGAVEWSGETLAHDLREFLGNGTATNVWRASAELLARGGADDWLQYVGDLLGRLRGENRKTTPAFWNHLACSAYIAAFQNPVARTAMRDYIEGLVSRDRGMPEGDGLRLILDMLSE